MSATEAPETVLIGGMLHVERVRESRLPTVDLPNVPFSALQVHRRSGWRE